MNDFTSEFKLKHFGLGEWVNESNEFAFEHLGIKCFIKRHIFKEPCAEEIYFGGYLCGYVQIPPGHPYYDKHYDDIPIDCHGGLTYSENHWIGFDCAHSGDLVPSMQKMRKENGISDRIFPVPEGLKDCALFNPVYRNMEFCINECKSLVDQLIKKSSEVL